MPVYCAPTLGLLIVSATPLRRIFASPNVLSFHARCRCTRPAIMKCELDFPVDHTVRAASVHATWHASSAAFITCGATSCYGLL
eukprot:653544-Pleurochrysis_carterae.AAC.2